MPPIAIIIPCFKVYPELKKVLENIDASNWTETVFIIDDHCPLNSVKTSINTFKDKNAHSILKISYLRLSKNQGVGGAWLTGLQLAVKQGYKYFLKLDGDNQHDFQKILKALTRYKHISLNNCSDLAFVLKGNRFFSRESISKIPKIRLVGNIGLSFLSRLSSGNWGVSDPVCGCFLISYPLATILLRSKLEKRFLFESHLILKCSQVNARILEFHLDAIYGAERSNLNVISCIPFFLIFHLRALLDRVITNHLVKEMTPEGIFFAGFLFCIVNASLGFFHVYFSFLRVGLQTPTGTIVMLLLLCQSTLIFFVSFLKEDSSSYHSQTQKSGIDLGHEE